MDIRNSFALLTEEQLNNSDVLKEYGLRATPTDFAILLGYSRPFDGWWIDSLKTKNTKKCVDFLGNIKEVNVHSYLGGGIRLVVPYSRIKNLCTKIENKDSNILEVESPLYYPKNVTNNSAELEQRYQLSMLKYTGKVYNIRYENELQDNLLYENVSFPIMKRIKEYEYEGNKYIRFVAKKNIDERLYNKEKLSYKNPYWIKVEPIRFIVDEKQDFAITKEVIYGDIIFDKYEKEKYYGFSEPIIKKYIRKYLSKDIEVIEQGKIEEEQQENTKIQPVQEEKEYTPSVNIDEDISIQIELSGSKKEIIEILKKLRDMESIKEEEIVKMKLLEKHKSNYIGGHYGYRKHI